MDEIITEARTIVRKLHLGFKNLYPVEITECAFADDSAIFARNENDLQYIMDVWNNSLKTNEGKTKIIVISNNRNNPKVTLNDKIIERVESFKYLGCIVEEKGKQDLEMT
ncbi:hypothetical protein HHI36_008119 [Cryptolaemus montrouzieri]|uniref:Reverse transcriptase domain-containing protein n=1 Tax=Cryptolaemus montrouzieri TaxID=559131 RepID=A0ABD2MSF9_9CUCU